MWSAAAELPLWDDASFAGGAWSFSMRVPAGRKAVEDYRTPGRFATFLASYGRGWIFRTALRSASASASVPMVMRR